MKFRILEDFRSATQVKPLLFGGLNRKELIEDQELSDGVNLDSELIPAISPRGSTKLLRTLASPQYFKMINNKQVYIDGTKFYFDGVERGTLTLGRKSMVDFNGVVVIFPDKKYYDYVDNVFGSFTCPYDIQYATVHYNRVFGIKGSDVYASKVGDFKTWDEYDGTELDSWAADVYSPGDFTGITSYQDHVIFFKRDQMYELYGYTPSQFKIIESAKMGCIDDRSIAEVGGILFFMSEKGVQSYSGGFPRSVSEKLNLGNVTEAVAIGDGRKYYVAIDGKVYIHDTWQNNWIPYIDMAMIDFGKSNDDIYALGKDGKLIQFNSGEEVVKWEAKTKIFDDGTFRKKSIKTVRLKLKMDINAEIKVYISIDEGDFQLKKYVINTETYHMTHREVFITIPIQRANTYQIKLVGQGRSVVYGEREYLLGSDR